MYSDLPGAAQLLGDKPRLEPEREFFLVWYESSRWWGPGKDTSQHQPFSP